MTNKKKRKSNNPLEVTVEMAASTDGNGNASKRTNE